MWQLRQLRQLFQPRKKLDFIRKTGDDTNNSLIQLKSVLGFDGDF
jgi:hypothetical protein